MASSRELQDKIAALERENRQLNQSLDDNYAGNLFMEHELEKARECIGRLHSDIDQLEAENSELNEQNKMLKAVLGAAMNVLEEAKRFQGALVGGNWAINDLFTAVIDSGKVMTGKLARSIWVLQEGEGMGEGGWRAAYYGDASNFV